MAQDDNSGKAITPVSAVTTAPQAQAAAQTTAAKATEEPKVKTGDETNPEDSVEISPEAKKEESTAKTSKDNAADETQTDETAGKTEEEKKAEEEEEQQTEEEKKLKELEQKIEDLKQQIMEDAKNGDMKALESHVKELEGLEQEKQALLQASQPQTGAPQAVPAASSAGAAPAAASPGSYPAAAAPAYAAPVTGSSGNNNVPVSNNTTPVAGRPHGLSEIKRTFGEAGTNLVTVKMPAGEGGKMINVTCNAKIADKMKGAFEEIKAKGLSDEIHSFDGCYNYRNKRGGSSLSTHAWGISFDVNASENPMGSTKQTAGQKQLAEIFAKYGFYQIPDDPMHFQYCTGY